MTNVNSNKTKENFNEIKKICQDFFEKMGILEDIEVGKIEEKRLPIKIKVEEPRVLIGQNGKTLLEIQYLLRVILRKRIGNDFYLDLDINDYKKKKIEYLKELVQAAADHVVLTKKIKELPSMSAYERRIVHLELSEREDVVTESQGQGEERRVIIKPHLK